MREEYQEIQLLSTVEAIRSRPTMYVGDLSRPDIINSFITEVLCIGIDEAISGDCNEIEILVDKDDTITITENGIGLSMAEQMEGISYAESLMTELYACRKEKENQVIGSKVCEIGLAVVNALSESCKIENNRNGQKWFQEYKYGEKVSPFILLGETSDKGVKISFKADKGIIQSSEVNSNKLEKWLYELDLDVCHLTIKYTNISQQIDKIFYLGNVLET